MCDDYCAAAHNVMFLQTVAVMHLNSLLTVNHKFKNCLTTKFCRAEVV